MGIPSGGGGGPVTSLDSLCLPMFHPHRVTGAVPRRIYPSPVRSRYVGRGSEQRVAAPPRAGRQRYAGRTGIGPRAPASADGVVRRAADGEGGRGATAAPAGHVQRTSSAGDDRRLGAAGRRRSSGAVASVRAETNNDLSLPGTGSQARQGPARRSKFPPQQNGANPIVFDVSPGQAHRPGQQAGDQRLDQGDPARQPHVYSVTNPLSSAGQTAGLLSKDKQTAFAPVLLDMSSGDLTDEIAQNVFDATEPAQQGGHHTSRRRARSARRCPTSRPRPARSSASSPR